MKLEKKKSNISDQPKAGNVIHLKSNSSGQIKVSKNSKASSQILNLHIFTVASLLEPYLHRFISYFTSNFSTAQFPAKTSKTENWMFHCLIFYVFLRTETFQQLSWYIKTIKNSLWHYLLTTTDCHGQISTMLENKIYWALASLQLLGVVAAIVAVAVNVDASISLMSSNSQARSFSLNESW